MMNDLPLQATAFLILFCRVGAVLMLLPVFSEEAIPGRIRLLMAFAMSLALWGLLGPRTLPAAGADALLSTLLIELGIGLALGTMVKFMFSAIVMAGSVISLQIGLSAALLFDPSLGGQTPVLAKLMAVAGALFCLGLGLHHLWIAAIIRSYAVFPVGTLPVLGDLATLGLATLSKATVLAISLAGPFLVYGIVFNVALGFSARLAPALQVFFIAQPLNILLGIALFATTVGTILAAFATSFTDWMQSGWSLP